MSNDYLTFQLLAGVGRRYMRAIPLIVPLRGVPVDACQEATEAYKSSIEAYGGAPFTQDFGHSWFTMDEFINYDFNQWFTVTKEDARELHHYLSLDSPMEQLQYRLADLVNWEYQVEQFKKAKELGIDRIVFWFDN